MQVLGEGVEKGVLIVVTRFSRNIEAGNTWKSDAVTTIRSNACDYILFLRNAARCADNLTAVIIVDVHNAQPLCMPN